MAKTETLKVSQIRINEDNPRQITEQKFQQLIDSILVFPEMMSMRPIVVDDTQKALGGNQRTQALKAILKLSAEELEKRIKELAGFQKKNEGEQQQLLTYWTEWLKKPVANIIRADQLTEEQKREFVIKDNVSFGSWEWDKLANEWDSKELNIWGMDVWEQPSQEEIDSNDPTLDENLDKFFEEADGTQKDKDTVIAVHIPHEEEDLATIIRPLIKEALKDYPNIRVE